MTLLDAAEEAPKWAYNILEARGLDPKYDNFAIFTVSSIPADGCIFLFHPVINLNNFFEEIPRKWWHKLKMQLAGRFLRLPANIRCELQRHKSEIQPSLRNNDVAHVSRCARN